MEKCKFNVEWTEKAKFKDWLVPVDHDKQQSFFNHQPPKPVHTTMRTMPSGIHTPSLKLQLEKKLLLASHLLGIILYLYHKPLESFQG